ncbi:hypothetical protein GCM10009800_41320 [Nocardiopsis rhodophaea]
MSTVNQKQKDLYERPQILACGATTAKFHDPTSGHGHHETHVVTALAVTDPGVDIPRRPR